MTESALNMKQDLSFASRADKICANPKFGVVVHWLGESFHSHQPMMPRAVSVFSSRQRWLLAHISLGLHFRRSADPQSGLMLRNFVQAVLHHKVASRNTAIAFMLELIKYGLMVSDQPLDERGGRSRLRVSLKPSEAAMASLSTWYVLHLQALDMLDGSGRVAQFSANVNRNIALISPLVCDGLLACEGVRNPGALFAIFDCVDEGSLLMDRLICGSDPAAHGESTITSIPSISELVQGLNLSRAHTARIVTAAEKIGALGWTGRRGHSLMWISREFRQNYAYFQASKLAVVDTAFTVTHFASGG